MRAVGGAPTPLLRVYQTATTLIAPLAYGRVSRKLRRAGVDERRVGERMGYATLPRPEGRLIWFHAASVGESLSVLTLIRRLGERFTDVEFLITSGTATSAELIAKRMPPRCRHQFAPLDVPGVVDRFYGHWAPNAGIFVESELWPNILIHGRRTDVPLALVNARLSEKSVQGWRRWPETAKMVMNVFRVLLAQNKQSADNLVLIGADPARVKVGSNLKATSDPLPVDEETLTNIQAALESRPVWIASSTHPGEEEIVLQAHKALLSKNPDLCLILVPRHPERGDAVTGLIKNEGLTMARRSVDEPIADETQVYLADTLGETGTWYALSPMVFLGGSLLPIGGHNPFEPAQAGAAVLTGPNVTNFVETFAPMQALGAAQTVEDAPQLAAAIARWVHQEETLQTAQDAARAFVQSRQSALEEVISTLCKALDLD